MNFTASERALLSNYITNVDGNIFAIKNLPGMVGGVFARYSRAKGSLKETLLKEFLKHGVIDPKHCEELLERILVAYGDDSVGELEGANVSFEDISNLAAKIIEDKRIGGSPIEQSSRYVFYDQKDEAGRWKYLRPKEITQSPHAAAYETGMDRIFELYHRAIEPMTAFYQQKKPLEEAEYDILGTGEKQRFRDLKDEKDIKAFQRTYNFDLKTKSCDTIRCLLPASTFTQVGMFGNGRYFQELISHLYTQNLSECQDIGKKCHQELSKLIAPFVKRAKRNEWLAERRKASKAITEEILGNRIEPQGEISVDLLPPPELLLETLALVLFPYAKLSLSTIIDTVKALPKQEHLKILEASSGNRANRRHRADRALEAGYPLLFEITADFGSYRDLQRHRMFTQQRQLLTTQLGFLMPPDLLEAGLGGCVDEAREISEELYKKIIQNCGDEAGQYCVLFGHGIRWTIGCNLRAAAHMIELRTTPQGHPNYRKVCQLMAKAILKRHPWTTEMFKFTDYEDYTWARGDSEARQRVKEKKLDEKYQPTAK